MTSTDKNGDPLVGDILDIIDKERSRYKVAVAIAEYIREVRQNELSLACHYWEEHPNLPATYLIDRSQEITNQFEVQK